MTASPVPTTAVVVCFRPAASAHTVIESAASECSSVVVVDNTPLGEESTLQGAAFPPNIVFLYPGSNLGLSGALNLALGHLPPDTVHLLLLDQDSILPTGMVASLSSHLIHPEVVAAAPAPWDVNAERYLDPRTSLRPEVADMDAVITSGLLVKRSALCAVAPLREDFFLGCVDQDLCLRLRAGGGRIVQDRRLRLPHRLGDTRWHSLLGLKLRATHHPTWRLYEAGRNGTLLSREKLRSQPAWSIRNVAQLGYHLLSILAFEPPRLERASWFLRGVWDGARARRPRIELPPPTL